MKALKIWFQDHKIHLEMEDGSHGSHPLGWFPALAEASSEQRQKYHLSPFGIHWPELDEDLSYEGFFQYDGKGKSQARA